MTIGSRNIIIKAVENDNFFINNNRNCIKEFRDITAEEIENIRQFLIVTKGMKDKEIKDIIKTFTEDLIVYYKFIDKRKGYLN